MKKSALYTRAPVDHDDRDVQPSDAGDDHRGDGRDVRERVARPRYIPGDFSLRCNILHSQRVIESEEMKQQNAPKSLKSALFRVFCRGTQGGTPILGFDGIHPAPNSPSRTIQAYFLVYSV